MSDKSSQLKIVPGAPPMQLTKSQLKKRRKAKGKGDEDAPDSPSSVIPDATSAALIEEAPVLSEGAKLAPELVAQPAPKADEEVKPSPIVDLINKRVKAANKKIVRCGSRSSPLMVFNHNPIAKEPRICCHGAFKTQR